MSFKTIRSIQNLKGRRVLVRVDFNVPMKSDKIINDYKIRRGLDTVVYLASKGAKVIMVSHLGRPNGYDKKLSLEPVARHIQTLLGTPVSFLKIKEIADVTAIAKTSTELHNGEIALIDNIRFLKEERDNKITLAKELAKIADIFVSECFAVSHHAAPSISGVPRFLPSYAGLLLFQEVSVLSKVMKKPKKPLVVILGGVKVETKIPLLKNLLPKASYILVGGGIASTYWWAQGKKVGATLVGKEYKKDILKYCKNKKVILPVDVVVGDAKGKNVSVKQIDSAFKISQPTQAIYDIGPHTVRLFAGYLKKAHTLIWNGAMGMFEVKPYHHATQALAHVFAARSKGLAYGVAGGGETVEILEAQGLTADVDLVSTGGGAMLEFLGGKKLPGIVALH